MVSNNAVKLELMTPTTAQRAIFKARSLRKPRIPANLGMTRACHWQRHLERTQSGANRGANFVTRSTRASNREGRREAMLFVGCSEHWRQTPIEDAQ